MGGLRVLVVDPHQDNRDSLALLLRLWGHEPCLAPDGLTALQQSKSFHPQVVLTEVLLPGLNGWQLARRLREEQPGPLLLVALSGYFPRQDQGEFDVRLLKPADPREIQEMLASFSR